MGQLINLSVFYVSIIQIQLCLFLQGNSHLNRYTIQKLEDYYLIHLETLQIYVSKVNNEIVINSFIWPVFKGFIEIMKIYLTYQILIFMDLFQIHFQTYKT